MLERNLCGCPEGYAPTSSTVLYVSCILKSILPMRCSSLPRIWMIDRRFEPAMDEERRAELLHNWHRAVGRAANWIE